jgi:uracil-DNA glycosylase
VRNYQEDLPIYFPLLHPSPRNQNWVKINPWFMEKTVPELKKKKQLADSRAKQQGKAD